MARPAADRVKAVWTGTGTGTMTLGGAAPGEPVIAFPASLNGQIVPYLIMHSTAQEAEAGYGLYTHSGATLSRLYRYYPTPGGSAVSFSSGTKFVSPTVITAHIVPNIATTNPSVNDDVTAGFLPGMHWINSATPAVFYCVSSATGTADWNQLDIAGGGSAVWGGITGTLSSQTDLVAEFAGKADTTHTQSVSSITGGTNGELMGFNVDGDGQALAAAGYLNPAQISPAERTAGTETALRSVSPADIKSMAITHGGGGAGGLNPIDSAATSLTVNHTNVGNLYDFITDGTINVTLDAQTTVPGSGSKIIGLRKGATGTVNVIMESGAGYFVAGDDYGGTPATATFQVTGFAWVEIRSNVGGNNAVFIVGGDTSLPEIVNGAVTFGGALDVNAAVDFSQPVVLSGSATFDAGAKLVHSNLVSVVTGITGPATLTTAAHLGRLVVVAGAITIPTTTTGFHCLVKASASTTLTFNGTVTSAGAAGQVCSVVVQSATVVIITPWTTPQTLT